MKRIAHTLSCLLLLTLIPLSYARAADLAQMQSIYSEQIQKVEQQIRAERLQLPQEYLGALRGLENEYQQAGDLPALLAVQKERKQFAAHPRIKDLAKATTPAKLTALQTQFIQRDSKIRGSSKTRLNDLKEQYTRALQNLQRELTRQSHIEDAVAVMNAVEALKSSQPGTAPLSAPRAKSPTTASPRPRSGELSIDDLRHLLKGEIKQWNSRSGKISIAYDFSDTRQGADWKGGRIDANTQSLVCNKTTAWLLPQFSSISQLEYRGDFRRSGERTRANIGNTLFIDMLAGADSHVVIHQQSEQNPTVEIPNNLKRSIPNHAKVTLAGRKVTCAVNYQQTRSGDLSLAVTFPAFVGFGYAPDNSAYKAVRVTGVLSPAYQTYLRSKRQP